MWWCIYYRGARSYSSDDGPWSDAPSEGVLAVVEVVGERETVHMGADHYQLEDDGTIVLRDTRTLLSAIGLIEMSAVKFGWYASHTQMALVNERINADRVNRGR